MNAVWRAVVTLAVLALLCATFALAWYASAPKPAPAPAWTPIATLTTGGAP